MVRMKEGQTMSKPLRGKLSVPDDVLVRELQGESVLLNLNTESYFGLDDVGTRMWAALTGSPSLESAYEILLSEYEVEPERLRADLRIFVDRLAELGLINLSDV
jgi:hypothetical protein